MQAHTACEVCLVERLSNTLWNICCALTKAQLLVLLYTAFLHTYHKEVAI